MEQVHQDHMETLIREVADSIPADISSLRIIKGRQLMADVHDVELVIYLQDLAFDGTNKEVFMTDV